MIPRDRYYIQTYFKEFCNTPSEPTYNQLIKTVNSYCASNLLPYVNLVLLRHANLNMMMLCACTSTLRDYEIWSSAKDRYGFIFNIIQLPKRFRTKMPYTSFCPALPILAMFDPDSNSKLAISVSASNCFRLIGA